MEGLACVVGFLFFQSLFFNGTDMVDVAWQVKLVKCLVENVVVDISFNQIGGLCTLCFLEEVSPPTIRKPVFNCRHMPLN